MSIGDDDQVGGVDVEHLLGLADEPSSELRERLTMALRYTVSWEQAVGDDSAFLQRIYEARQGLSVLLNLIPVDSVFAGKDAKAAYEVASANWAQLYRDLVFSADTLPQPGLLDVAGGLVDGLFQAPATALKFASESLANALSKAVGGTLAALWPWLALAGGAWLVWTFRAPLLGVVRKAAA